MLLEIACWWIFRAVGALTVKAVEGTRMADEAMRNDIM
jgi:hypothetical protein